MAKRFRLSVLNNWTSVFLTAVERGGNALPHPATLFAILSGVVVIVSGIAVRTGIEAIHPGTGRPSSRSACSPSPACTASWSRWSRTSPALRPSARCWSDARIGVMEASGLIGAALRLLVLSAPKRLLTFVIVLSGVLSNTASEIGYVLLVPLGGIIFLGAGRHP